MKVVAFLPAKGTSSRIESKNMKLLDGKPLFHYTLEKLVECEFIDEVYLDSESEEIFESASEIDSNQLRRDPKLADNKTDGHILFHNEAKQVDADIYIQILCTSPFIKKETIKKGIDILKNQPEYDSVVLVKREKQYLWDEKGPKYDKDYIPNSVDLKDTIIETMGLYITRKNVALEDKKRIGNSPYLMEAEPIEAIDVNYPEEFELAEYIMAGIREKEREKFRNLSRVLSSPMLSDIMDDLGIDGFIGGFTLNIDEKKVMGRAKTLKLRALKEGEDFRGIYDALNSYKTIVPNDIIVVENEVSDYAYFGNLNANLAIRQGAVATIVGGKTRDTSEVSKMDYPVFSTGRVAKDVRKRATTESINKTIKIKDITVRPGDLIFADAEGIIVIPKTHEAIVIEKALEVLATENNIISEILLGYETKDIVDNNGAF
ncbi:CMP-N-acetylneuraminic acid synthetase/regulator of RNase E activity RraA [Gracilibacillus halotolerans]|uniref:CMP-N-acetylneuraminic acid synthetase/regulator of RNase E activity RraA n=1 Tax=Gracilibacillus halotolerans TaxID=74386 RepID=A0A841RMX3_9BACI|nr:cytidyltransferase [Gracilibacillus halotolerans]MBB6512294.1 CMP-N-acetylneuraminic acid synthetase/regulator of RNase E activity RraA [Gracilibacillus halotolerans]